LDNRFGSQAGGAGPLLVPLLPLPLLLVLPRAPLPPGTLIEAGGFPDGLPCCGCCGCCGCCCDGSCEGARSNPCASLKLPLAEPRLVVCPASSCNLNMPVSRNGGFCVATCCREPAAAVLGCISKGTGEELADGTGAPLTEARSLARLGLAEATSGGVGAAALLSPPSCREEDARLISPPCKTASAFPVDRRLERRSAQGSPLLPCWLLLDLSLFLLF